MTGGATVDRVTGDMEPRELRVSDAEREHVGELNAVLVDLPGATLTPAATRDVLALGGGVGGIKRRGYWLVPATVAVSATMGDVLLDFTEADFGAPITTIDVRTQAGDTVLVIPHGATVDADGVRSAFGTVKDTTVKQRHQGNHHFVVQGSVKMGDVKIMHPSSWNVGPFTVHRPFRITWRRRS